ncbi:MAG TPA: DUF1540 domain-containing protein [Syntrophomonadaceae bacterium]|nr:DUF1540 domain-containing protein [Syntrophomonadaceae bacterium]
MGKQTIGCTVSSCKFNSKGQYCGLESIEVSPVQNVNSGIAQDESLCANYEKR